jgi:hypothetical protein
MKVRTAPSVAPASVAKGRIRSSSQRPWESRTSSDHERPVSMTVRIGPMKSTSRRLWAKWLMGRPMSWSTRLMALRASGVKRRMRSSRSMKTTPISVERRRLSKSSLACVS